jgi:hypothetical protein
MTLAIMQPYFFPYIGYFQLIAAVDKFVIYDNIQFSKKGWINRNRILVDGRDQFITLPLKKDSDYLDIVKRQLSDTFLDDRQKILRRIKESYHKAPHFKNVFPFADEVLNFEAGNLFSFLFNSVLKTCEYLGIRTEFVISSSLNIDHSLKAEDKVLAIATHMNASTYINAIGGKELYSAKRFSLFNIDLCFIQSNPLVYQQFKNEFVPWLSILDVMMFNSNEEIKKMLQSYTLA